MRVHNLTDSKPSAAGYEITISDQKSLKIPCHKLHFFSFIIARRIIKHAGRSTTFLRLFLRFRAYLLSTKPCFWDFWKGLFWNLVAECNIAYRSGGIMICWGPRNSPVSLGQGRRGGFIWSCLLLFEPEPRLAICAHLKRTHMLSPPHGQDERLEFWGQFYTIKCTIKFNAL